MTLEIQVGDPPVEGRYVVYHPCAALQIREWCEPEIATWHGGKWHARYPVWGWIGPLPVVHGNDCLKKIETEKERPPKTWDEVFADKRKCAVGWVDIPAPEYDL